MSMFLRTFPIAFALLVGVPPNLTAQNWSAADDKELGAYRLTPQAVQKYEALARHLAEWAKTDAKAQAAIKQQGRIEPESDDEELGITALVAKVTPHKPFVDALQKAGMTPREFVVFSLALLEGTMNAYMKQTGDKSVTPAELNHPNTKFADQRYAELVALRQKVDSLGYLVRITAKKTP